MVIPIRHKRGTSDPGASDFSSTAELLVNTADGGLFTKTDSGSVVEIGSGGGGGGAASQITVSDESSDTTCFPVFVTDGGTVPPKVDFGSLQYNSSTGNLAATTFTGSGSGLTNVEATEVSITNNSATNETVYLTFVDGDSGAQGAEVDSNLTYNPSTNILSALNFSGNGSALTNISNTSEVNITNNSTNNETVYLNFVDSDSSGSQGVEVDSNLTYNPSTNILSALNFAGNGSALTALNASNLGSGTIPDARFPATLPAVSGANLTNLPAGSTIPVVDESSDTTCFPVFTTAATGDQAPKTGTNLNFNSSNGTLTATTFSGSGSSLTGLTGASAATYGDGSNVAQIAVDANGRITGISNVSISGGGGSGSPLRYLHVDGSGSQAISTSLATVDFDTTIATSDASDFTVGSGGEITVVNAGTYYVEYSLDGDQSSGNNRVIVTGVVQVNGTAVTGSECSVYSRNTADGDFTAVGSCIANLTANDVVRVQVQKNDGNITTSLELDTSGLSMFTLSGSGPQGDQGPAGPSDIPQNSQTGAYTLVAGDNGKHINITTGGVTVPSGVFSAGNVVSIYNDSGSNQTITQGSSVTLRLAGSATTGNRTLAQYGLCSALCVASNEFVISGAGLS